jgi:ubiquinone/menaquinone biosynthesis C-methylase UbiE
MPKFIGWVPTQPEFIKAFFDLAPVQSSDVVYDLGSGDGRLLFGALEAGAGKCIGIDIDPDRVKVAQEAAKEKGYDGRVKFVEADILDIDLSEATVVLCYLFPSASAALGPKFDKELKPGTRVVMESFPVPGWKSARVNSVNYRDFYYYVMPAAKEEGYEYLIKNQSSGYYEY